jgi:hypothetical protein
LGFPKGASIPFGQGRGQNPAREVASFINPTVRSYLLTNLAVEKAVGARRSEGSHRSVHRQYVRMRVRRDSNRPLSTDQVLFFLAQQRAAAAARTTETGVLPFGICRVRLAEL